MVKLKLTHSLLRIEDVPDNLAIAKGEEFSLTILDPAEGAEYDYFLNNDPVLEEVPAGAPFTRRWKATGDGNSEIQVQRLDGEKPVIERRYKVLVFSEKAVSATLESRGVETLNEEQS